TAIGDGDEIRVVESDDLAFGDELGDAAPRHHQDQGGDDRLDVEHGDQQTVPQAAADTDRKGHQHGNRHAVAGIDQGGGNGAGDRHDGTDRKVDAARGDDQGHADRQDGNRGTAIEDIDDAAEEMAVLQAD